jgi:hypothetical protein
VGTSFGLLPSEKRSNSWVYRERLAKRPRVFPEHELFIRLKPDYMGCMSGFSPTLIPGSRLYMSLHDTRHSPHF